jgi:hypothetical protein
VLTKAESGLTAPRPTFAKVSEAVIQNWWRQGIMGGAKAHSDGIVAFSQTDFTADLKKITVVPVGNLIWLAVDRESGDAVVQ